MNIGCTACPARYSVPDEKIVGRKVRVTCKRCGAKLVVDGTKTPPSVVSESLPPASGSGEEYLVAFDDQHKKSLTVRALVTLYGQRVIDAATLIWREGMSEWKPLFEVEPVRLALERAGYRPSQRPPSDSEQRTSSTGEDDGDVTRIYRPNEELAARDDEATKIFESPRSSRPRPPAWNEPAKWRRDGARDPLGKGEWRERGAPAQSVPRVPKLPGGWSERGVEEDEVTRMMAPLDEAAPKSESEPPATGERSEASVLFSTRSIEQAHALSSDPLGRPLLVARPAAPLLGSEPPLHRRHPCLRPLLRLNVLAPPSRCRRRRRRRPCLP